MPKISISQAARVAGTQRSTLYRAMERGDLSFEILNGKRVLDISELERVFPSERPKVLRGTASDTSKEQRATPDEQPDFRVSLAVLQAENQLLREQLVDVQGERDYLRSELSKASSTVKLLEDNRRSAPWWQVWRKAA